MFTFLVLALFIAVAIGFGLVILRDRIQSLEARLRWSAKEDRNALEKQMAALTARVRNLELRLEPLPRIPTQPVAQPEPVPSIPIVLAPEPSAPRYFIPEPAPPSVPTEPAPVRAAAPISQEPPPPVSHERPPVAESTPIFPRTPPRLTWSERLRESLRDSEWEALVAGSLLNKLGALLLVIGIALFLRYSFRMISPAGRAATAAVISAAILIGGVVLERRQRYRVFSRGLIGAGWAALYTTTYAMYALPAAQIISNPFLGSVLLLIVSAGMIAHALHYRAQAITAVAYFSAFAALAVTPSTPFALASLIPLSASLLYFAWRFDWYGMALWGLFATYATCLSRSHAAAASLYSTTLLLIAYWLLFELFDILRARRGRESHGITWIFPLNAIGFLTLVYRAWSIHAPQSMWLIAAISAALFFTSAMARIAVCPAPSQTPSKDPLDRIRRGTYEAPLTLAAVLAGLAILGRVTGFWTNVALAFEAELLYLAGMRFQSRFLRALGGAGFLVSLNDVWTTALSHPGSVTVLGRSLHNWTPSLIVHAGLFYLNRVLAASPSAFSFAASGLAALVIAYELSPRNAVLALFLFALLLFELGLRKRKIVSAQGGDSPLFAGFIDFRLQSYLLAAATACFALSIGGFAPHAPLSVRNFAAGCAIACWLFTARMLFASRTELAASEKAGARDLFAVSGSGFALLTLWMWLPGPQTVIAWTCLALAWLAIALRLNLASFRWLAAGILGISYARLLGMNLTATWDTQNAAEHWLIPLFVIAALYFMWHIFRRIAHDQLRSLAPAFTWLAALATVYLFDLGITRFYIVSAWGMLAFALLITGLLLNIRAFRWQSYLIWACAAVSCVFVNFSQSGHVDKFGRIFGAALLIASLFAAQFLLPRNPARLSAPERHIRTFVSLAAMLLLTALLNHEVSGGLLTVAWGIQALVALGFGFPARERILRFEGLAVFALCILKLFLYDLRNLETLYRILSFIALGAILLGVSLIYTRFRNQIQRYL